MSNFLDPVDDMFQPLIIEKQKKVGRNRKPIWDNFVVVGPIKSGHTGAKCKYCDKAWKNAKPQDLEDHIALRCKQAPGTEISKYLKVVKERGNEDTATQFSEISQGSRMSGISLGSRMSGIISQPVQQQVVTDYYESEEINEAKEDRCTRALTKFFVCCGIPFRVVEHPFFVDFIKSLCPGFKIPGRDKLSTTLLNQELAFIITAINDELQNEKNLTLGKN